jgi:L-fuculose-phosphate aldolase
MTAAVRLVTDDPQPDAQLRADVVAAAREMLALDLVVGSVGNVSARCGSGLMITPTRMDYADMSPGDVVMVGPDGAVVEGARRPSREWPMHAAIYAARPDVSAVVHTHSVHATAWSFLGEPLEATLEEAGYYGIGPMTASGPAPAGSPELAGAAVAALGRSAAALLGAHGAVVVGSAPREAVVRAAVVERQAHVAWLLRGAHELNIQDRRRRG